MKKERMQFFTSSKTKKLLEDDALDKSLSVSEFIRRIVDNYYENKKQLQISK